MDVKDGGNEDEEDNLTQKYYVGKTPDNFKDYKINGVEIALLVISGINLITGFLSPLVVAGAYAIQNIKNSSCCDSSVEMRDDPVSIEQPKKEPNKDVTDWEVFDQNVMNKIKEKRRSQIIEEMMGETVTIPQLRNN
eukprot:gene8446-271_t